jgi:hypothetical protein
MPMVQGVAVKLRVAYLFRKIYAFIELQGFTVFTKALYLTLSLIM